jgi:hypothetical protein
MADISLIIRRHCTALNASGAEAHLKLMRLDATVLQSLSARAQLRKAAPSWMRQVTLFHDI